jgi:acetoin utilization protein AcuB
MLVRDLMSAPVETLDARATCAEAATLFEERGLRRAPVTRAGVVVGMLTDRDLARILPGNIAAIEKGTAHPAFKRHIDSVIKAELYSVHPNDHIEQAAQIMLRAKVGALPVLDEGRAVGILTESDIFKLFVRRGMTQRGHRLILRAPAQALHELNPAALAVGASARVFDLAIFPMEKSRVAISIKLKAPDIDSLISTFLEHGYELVLVEES